MEAGLFGFKVAVLVLCTFPSSVYLIANNFTNVLSGSKILKNSSISKVNAPRRLGIGLFSEANCNGGDSEAFLEESSSTDAELVSFVGLTFIYI